MKRCGKRGVWRLRLDVAAILLFALLITPAPVRAQAPPRLLGGRPDFAIQELPDGPFRQRLEQLPLAIRERALARLRIFSFPGQDARSLRVDDEGGVFYADEFPAPAGAVPATSEPTTSAAAVPVSPFPDALKFHSRPGATNVILLDFDGDTVTGTAWNSSLGRDPIVAVAFSTDADFSTYSDAEQVAIRRVWQRVAEDFAPFNVDVTTEPPPVMHNRVAQALVTRNTDASGQPNPSSSAGGVAYISVFGSGSYYRPAWVYYNNISSSEGNIAEASSHEIGHNIGLSHDGRTDGTEYYTGHGSGDTGWAPIMGVSYGDNVSTWSKGEYYLANNAQDDLAIIATDFGYRPDDAGAVFGLAPMLVLTNGTNIVSTTPETDPANANASNKGVIERTGDVDLYAFTAGNGPMHFDVRPWISPSSPKGGNLDIVAKLYNDSGTLLAQTNPVALTTASLDAVATGGVYYLELSATGVGNPTTNPPSGYTAYASLGQYFLSGRVTDPSDVVIPPSASLATMDITDSGKTNHAFAVIYSDNLGVNVATIDSADVRVTGPGGYAQTGRLVNVSNSSNGTPRTATYTLAPPDGVSWSPVDNGAYGVWMLPGAVADTEGAFVPAQLLGTFTCSVPAIIYAADLSTDPGWTLGDGWAYGVPAGNEGDPTSGATGTNVIGYNLAGSYSRTAALTYAVSPPFNCSAASTVTVAFKRFLGYRSGDTAIVDASADGTNWMRVWTASGNIINTLWIPVEYDITQVAAHQPAVRLRWGLGGNGDSRTSFGWNIDDVEVRGDAVAQNRTLAVAVQQAGWGSVTPPGGVYTDGSQVTLSATASNYFRFAAWQGSVAGTSSVVSVVMTNNLHVTAVFEEITTTNHAVPLAWLAQHGFTNNPEQAASLPGSNGIPVWASYVAGLDPADPGSVFAVETEPAPAGLVLQWNSVSGRVYTIYRSTNLLSGFSPLQGAIDMPWPRSSFTADVDAADGCFDLGVRIP